MSLASLCNTTITIQRLTASQDSSLGSGGTWTSDPPLPASVQPVNAREAVLFSQRNVRVSHKIYLAQDPGATMRDRVLDNGTGKIYRVVNSFNMAGRARGWRLEVLEQAS